MEDPAQQEQVNEHDLQDHVKRQVPIKDHLGRIFVLVFVIALSVYILSISDRISTFVDRIPGMGWYAYPAIFLVSIVANATIVIPIPGVALTALFGSVFNPIGVAIAAGLGASFGELSGYLAGFSGQEVIERTKWGDRLQEWMEKYGEWTVLVLAFIPNPLFDMAGMSAGALKMPVQKFLVWCALGKILKMLVFAYAGGWIASIMR
ncbi:MAG: VTT domain-containing protein [Anaerolineaceae bacterium]|nr:VTT domain-containing protein [Anaerolineaceae bacterium]